MAEIKRNRAAYEPRGTGRFYRVGCNQAADGLEKWDKLISDGFDDDPAANSFDRNGRVTRTTSNGPASGLDYGNFPSGEE